MPVKKTPSNNRLSDEELRRRVFANANVLFPSSAEQEDGGQYEIVYGTAPRTPFERKKAGFGTTQLAESPPWQYAMLVRRAPSGEFNSLLRGQAWSTSASWSMVLEGLLYETAVAIHKKFASASNQTSEANEDLPAYAPSQQA